MVQNETVSSNPATPSRWTVVFNRIAVVALAFSVIPNFDALLIGLILATSAFAKLTSILYWLAVLIQVSLCVIPAFAAVNLWCFRHYRSLLTATILVAFLNCSPIGIAVLVYLLLKNTKRAFQAERISIVRPIAVGVCLGICVYVAMSLLLLLAWHNDEAFLTSVKGRVADELSVLVAKELTKLSDKHPLTLRFGVFQGVKNPEMSLYNGGIGIGQTLEPEAFQAQIRFSKGTVPLKLLFRSPCVEKAISDLETLRGILSAHSQGLSDRRIEFSIGPPIGKEWCASKDEIVMSIDD